MTTRLQPNDVPSALDRARAQVDPALRAAVERIPDERMRRVAGYQLGWWDGDGQPTPSGGGKAIRPTLALLAAEAACGSAEPGIPAAVAVELIHNFSLLHDDIMDRDVVRRHRPTGWVTFGEGQAILAGNAMMAAAIDTLARAGAESARTVPALIQCVQELISGQSADLDLEKRDDVELADVIEMENGKTAALIAGSLGLGAMAAGAPDAAVAHVHRCGELAGLAFQLIDDVLGIVGDPATTGKSSSSDVRAGKRSGPVVAALRAGTAASAELARVLRDGPPESDADVARVVELIEAAGGISWARNESERLLADALHELDSAGLTDRAAVAEIGEVVRYLVRRDR